MPVAVAALIVASNPSPSNRALAKDSSEQAAASELTEHLSQASACRSLQEEIKEQVQARRVECEQQVQAFNACRAERQLPQGAELFGCGLGLILDVAAGGIAEPWAAGECGVASPRQSQPACSVPACEAELEVVEDRVLAQHGLTDIPRC